MDHRPCEDDNRPSAAPQVLAASAFHLHSDTAKRLEGRALELQGEADVAQDESVDPAVAVVQ